MPGWLPPFLGASTTVVLLWVALGVQRLRVRRPRWAGSLVRELRRWDGRLPSRFDEGSR
ncbi:MAG TPA: hypothetical protein VEH55_03855 [Gaiellaceae bacterium]|nr:hypothetical protein [Gaiellaceae bacterium]